ncbi:MAG: autotransporter outer membrane beta-barrel domain-containing protein [Chlorobiaceae bacterium]|nr:autotransporter outer membrane beta-barrel domain-containing protein [Chlorobiaceae bacterium]
MAHSSLVKRLAHILFFLSLQLTAVFRPLVAADWQGLVQPLGTENAPFLVDPSVLNASYGVGKGPWETGTMVTSITTTVPQFFVRFYNPTASVNPSNQEGGWVMRAGTVRGLTAEQVRDLFALPNPPTMMTLGVTNPGESLYTGIAGPIDGWGSGGGQQSQSNGGPYTTFFNGQAIMAPVLWYPALASTDNNRALGAYLVAHQPAPYSDMESVLNSLDVLCNPAGSYLFNSALASITPARFDNIATLGSRAVSLQSHAIDDRIDRTMLREAGSGIWGKGIKGLLRYPSEGFDGEVYGIVIGGDATISDNVRSGVSFGWMQGSLDWKESGGSARVDYYRFSAYSRVAIDQAFVQLQAGAGSSQGDTKRNLSVTTFYQRSPHGPTASPLSPLSRVADGSYGGWDANVDIRGGVVANAGPVKLLPSAGVGYLYQSRGSFTETGAGSLNLAVASAQSRTLLCHAELHLDRSIKLGGHRTLTPYMSVGWIYESRLDSRRVSASLNGWSDSFVTTLPDRRRHAIEGSAGVELAFDNNLRLDLCYSGMGEDDGVGGIALGVSLGL